MVQALLHPFESPVDFQRTPGLASHENTLGGYAANMIGISSLEARDTQTRFSAQDTLFNSLEAQKRRSQRRQCQ